MSAVITEGVADANLKAVGDTGVSMLFQMVSELIMNNQQYRAQQEERHSAKMDHVRNLNTLALMALSGTKVIQEKALDTSAIEVAEQALATADAISGLTSADVKTIADMIAAVKNA